MTRDQITQELKDLSHNIGVLERTKIGMGNYQDVMKGYQKVLRDLHLIVDGIFDIIKEK